MEAIVRLNIGGVRYTTTKTTLLSRGENYFTGLLDGSLPSTKDEQGAFFIDRSGQYFSPILDYLRTTRVHIPYTMSRVRVAEEASFFLIEGLMQHFPITPYPSSKTPAKSARLPRTASVGELAISAESLRNVAQSRSMGVGDIQEALLECLREAKDAADEGATSISLYLGWEEEEKSHVILPRGLSSLARPGAETLKRVLDGNHCEVMLTSMRERGFQPRLLYNAMFGNGATQYRDDALLIYWGETALEELLHPSQLQLKLDQAEPIVDRVQ